jgi:hypothetical protein
MVGWRSRNREGRAASFLMHTATTRRHHDRICFAIPTAVMTESREDQVEHSICARIEPIVAAPPSAACSVRDFQAPVDIMDALPKEETAPRRAGSGRARSSHPATRTAAPSPMIQARESSSRMRIPIASDSPTRRAKSRFQ